MKTKSLAQKQYKALAAMMSELTPVESASKIKYIAYRLAQNYDALGRPHKFAALERHATGQFVGRNRKPYNGRDMGSLELSGYITAIDSIE